MSDIRNKIRSFFADEYAPSYIENISIDKSTIQISNEPSCKTTIINKTDQIISEEITSNSIKNTEPMIKNNNNDSKESNKTTNFILPIPTDPDLLKLYNDCLECKACDLCNSALNLVFGDGNPNADIFIIGEAPGADEDTQGKPFVGRAGQLLIKLLNKYGVQREDIFIANILKHRPPNNRNPLPNEITACTPFLRQQIDLVKPKLLITLGNFSSQYILETKLGITKIRGSIQESSYGMVMPSLHPSAIIRGAYPIGLLEQDIVHALKFIGYDVELEE